MCLYCTMTRIVWPPADPCLAFARKPESSEATFEALPFWRAEGDVDPKAMPVARSTTRLTRFPHAALCRSWRRGFCCFHVRNIDLPCRSGGKSPARNSRVSLHGGGQSETAKSLRSLGMRVGVGAWMGHSVPSRRARDNLSHTDAALEAEFKCSGKVKGLNRSGFGDCGLVWELRYGSHEPLRVFVLRIE